MATNPQQDPYGYPKLDIKAARALNPHTQTIRIENILGGMSPTTHFSSPTQFRLSQGIDPALPINDSVPFPVNASTETGSGASGLLRPSPQQTTDNTVLTAAPMWIKFQPKKASVGFIFDAQGSAYTISTTTGAVTALSDAGTLSYGGGSIYDGAGGLEYYDNYMYFSSHGGTDITRYGPLSGGTAGFVDQYWTSVLSKAALTATQYPPIGLYTTGSTLIPFPNHVMHRHSDGKLYIADVVGNQGTIHYISTTKTTVEGDTDNGSKFSALTFGYGLWPTAIESYGSQLVIALSELTVSSHVLASSVRTKIAFWDTTSQNFNSITWVEFPDQIVSAFKNVDGILYAISGSGKLGTRVSQYVGGNTFKEVKYMETMYLPFPGAVDGKSSRLLFGAFTASPQGATVFSLGLQKNNISTGLFGTLGLVSNNNLNFISALALPETNTFPFDTPYLGWANLATGSGNNGVDVSFAGTYNATSKWWSQVYRIGQNFKITKIRIPLGQAVAANMIVTPTIYLDDGTSSVALATINNTNYPNGEKNIIIRPTSVMGQHNFWLELKWTGTALCVVGLPITIEYEPIPD